MKVLTRLNSYNKKVRNLVALSLLAPLCVFAQDEDLEELQGFTVTGSRIKQIDVMPLNPVITYDAEYISKTGARDLQDIIDELPQNQLGLSDREVFGFTPGAGAVNLRGAGVQYTLSLINGRRAAAYGAGAGGSLGFVNVQSIPLAAIDRIEILTDGASAIYGADAVTGVINYILKDDYEGLEVSGSYQNTFDTDTSYMNVSAVVGNVSEKSSTMFIVDYATRNSLFARDRDFSKSSDQSPRGGIPWPNFFGTPFGSPAVIEDLSTGLQYVTSPDNYTTQDLLTRPVQEADGITDRAFADLRDDYGDVITQPTDFMGLSPEYSKVSFYGTTNYQATEDVKVYLEAGFTRNEVLNTVHPVAFESARDLFDTDGNELTLSANNPYNPLGVNRTDGGTPTDVRFYNRNFVIGNRTADVTNDVLRLVLGAEGTLMDDYTYNVSGLYMVDYGLTVNGGGTLRSAAINSLTTSGTSVMDPTTTWNIFGRFTGGPLGGDDNNDLVTPALAADTYNEYQTKLYMANADFGGPLVDLPSGLIQFATGAEIREEEWYDRSDAASVNGDIVGRGGVNPSEAWRRVKSAYAEISVPIYEKFEAQVAGRYEKFSGDTGDNFSPKLAIRYRPLDWLVVRSSYSEGFRAPSLQELFQGANVAFSSSTYFDPLRDDESVASVRLVQAGNPELKPEESSSKYIGLAFEPTGKLEGLYVNVDWFSIDIDNRIEGESIQEIIDSNDNRVRRVDPNPSDIAQGWPGIIVEILDASINKAKMKMESVDFTIGYRWTHDTYGEFDARLVGSYLYSRQTQLDEASPFVENAGTFAEPEVNANIDITWNKGDWTVFSSINYTDKYEQYYTGFLGITEVYVKEYVVVDLGFTYSGFWGLDLTAQVVNLFDEEPPMSTFDQVGFDYYTHGPFQRMYRVGFRKQF